MKISRQKKAITVNFEEKETSIATWAEKLAEFNEIKIEKKEEKLKKELDEYITKNVQADARGNRYFFAVDYVGKDIILKKEARKSVSLNEEKAILLFTRKKLINRVLKIRETQYLDEEAIEELIEDGEVTTKEIESITDVTVGYAIKMVKRTEIEEDVAEDE
jgi:hypothetical protein